MPVEPYGGEMDLEGGWDYENRMVEPGYTPEDQAVEAFINGEAITLIAGQDRMEEVAKSVGRGLGIRWREPSKTIRTRQMNLRKKLLVDLGR